ncbi:MAG: hypothetical protein IJ313_03835 [Clostridia bacterium]|nr:hypothetical protein [Clostridia bacterium]
MDFEQIKNNLLGALGQLLALRMIVTSPSEKVADLPAVYVLLAALMAPGVCVVVLLLGLITRHAVRFEKDVVKM